MTLEELLKIEGMIVYKVRGVSMQPMLDQNKDLVTIRSYQSGDGLSENDVALYKRRKDGALVLHRVIEVREAEYVFLGDNCIGKEYGIREEDILGVLISYTHDGKTIDMQDSEYMKYVKNLRKHQEVRILYKRVRAKAGYVYRRVFLRNKKDNR